MAPEAERSRNQMASMHRVGSESDMSLAGDMNPQSYKVRRSNLIG
jgi:hypothetical protein